MKCHIIISIAFILFSCQNNTKEIIEEESLPKISIEKSVSFEEVLPFDTIYTSSDAELNKINLVTIKRQTLIDKKDDKTQLEELIIQKTFKRVQDLYLIDFTYPYLNETPRPSYHNFNQYVKENYLNIARVAANILEDKEMLTDTLRINRYKEQRYVNYKIYSVNKSHISVLFYKENYYPRILRPTYSFDCLL